MPKFQNGEVAIICNMTNFSARFNEEETTILSFIGIQEWRDDSDAIIKVPTYTVTTSFHPAPHIVAECNLKKKKPPEEEINWVEKLNLKAPNKETENA